MDNPNANLEVMDVGMLGMKLPSLYAGSIRGRIEISGMGYRYRGTGTGSIRVRIDVSGKLRGQRVIAGKR